jgi:hypothetical protein
VWAFDATGLNIPVSRQATFKEELRLLHQAASTYRGDRSVEKQNIEAKLKETYGSSLGAHFEEIQAKRAVS